MLQCETMFLDVRGPMIPARRRRVKRKHFRLTRPRATGRVARISVGNAMLQCETRAAGGIARRHGRTPPSMTRTLLVLALVCAAGCRNASQRGPADAATFPPHDLDRVKVGHLAPDFTLEDLHGRPVTLASFRGTAFVILVFYRGFW
jgi:hypothetical protein